MAVKPTVSSKSADARVEALRGAFPEAVKLSARLNVGLRKDQPWRPLLVDYLDKTSYGDVVILCREVDDLLKIRLSDEQLKAWLCDVLALDYLSLIRQYRTVRLFLVAVASELSQLMLNRVPDGG